MLALPVHELAHAWTAVKLGDSTPREQKRLSLNPFAHLDVFGSMALLLLGFGWAKPVEVNMQNLKKPRRDMAIIALAGPLANIIMALLGLMLLKLAIFNISAPSSLARTFIQVLGFMVNINLVLAVFNLLPIPPLDGSRILGLILPEKAYYFVMRYERFIMLAMFFLIWRGYLAAPISFLSDALFRLLDFLTRIIDIIFL